MSLQAGSWRCAADVGVVCFSSRRRHTRFDCDWSSDVCSSDLTAATPSLLSETPADRSAVGKRLELLRTDAKVRAGYVGLLREVWESMRVEWEEHGRSGERRVGEECRSRWSPYH